MAEFVLPVPAESFRGKTWGPQATAGTPAAIAGPSSTGAAAATTAAAAAEEAGFAYSHFDKKERMGRAADFSAQTSMYGGDRRFNNQFRNYRATGQEEGGQEFAYRHDADEQEKTFTVVETVSSRQQQQHRGGRGGGRGQDRWGGPGRGGGRGGYGDRDNNGRDGWRRDGDRWNDQRGGDRGGGRGGPGGRGGGGRYGQQKKGRWGAGRWGGRPRRDFRRFDIPASVEVEEDWVKVEELELSHLLKLSGSKPEEEDLLWCGTLDQCDDTFDRINTRTSRRVQKYPSLGFYCVTAKDDPHMMEFAANDEGNIFATDQVIAHLMAMPRSVDPWDIVIQKRGNLLFFDHRENFDMLTVSETSTDPPMANEDTPEYNDPERLRQEATAINQNFSQQILLRPMEESRKEFEPHPFFDGEDETFTAPASLAYRYRRFTSNGMRLVVRTELNSWLVKRDEEQMVRCFALNEWEFKQSGQQWRGRIDQQRGAVLGTELKNNSNKLAKWTAQAVLSGANLMKLGFVSRAAPTDRDNHIILATQFHKTNEFAMQINLDQKNIWGIVERIVNIVLAQPDGKFVLMKTPTRSVVTLYSVPLSFNESDDEDDDDEEDDDEDDLDDLADFDDDYR